MKTYKGKPLGKGSKGAAVVLAAAAFSSVLLSIYLLFGYASDMSDRQRYLEESVQISLSEKTAADYASFMYGSGLISPDELLPPLQTGGCTSYFRTIKTADVASQILEYKFPGISDLSVVPALQGMIVAGNTADSVVINYRNLNRLDGNYSFSVKICSRPDNWILSPTAAGIEPVCILACDYSGTDGLFIVDSDGTFRTVSLGDFELSNSSVITTGVTEYGPTVVITDGFNSGILINLETGSGEYMLSAAGTCPVVMPDGRLYGSVSYGKQNDISSDMAVKDVIFGDFDLDGKYDAAWAGTGCFTCLSSARDTVVTDESGTGQLVAWGYMKGRTGLGGLWMDENSELTWRKFVVTGFRVLENAETLFAGCEGRIVPDGNNFAAFRYGETVIAADSSGREIISATSGIPGDFDNSGMLDIAIVTDESVSLHLDPAGPESIILTVGIATGVNGKEPSSDIHCSIQTSEGIANSDDSRSEGRQDG